MIGKLMLAMALASAVSAEASATRWVRVADTDSAVYFVDADAIVRADAIVTIWLRTEFAQPGSRKESVAVEKWLHDCANRQVKLLAITFYKSNGDVVASAQRPRYRQDWDAIVPSSAGEVIQRRVCGMNKADDETERDPDEIT